MPDMRKRMLAAAFVIAAALPAGAQAADDFYKARLQEGRIAYETGNAAEAADLLRIGCFGLMDHPALLSEGLAWLALAQVKAGRAADVDGTVRRFLEVEKRFGVWAKAAVSDGARKEFEALLARRLPPEALASVPALAGLVETEEQKIAKLAPRERRRALEAKAAAEPAEKKWVLALARLAAEAGEPKETIRQAGKAIELDPQDLEARRLRAAALMARKSWAEALADLDALPPALFASQPALRADRFVCLAAAKEWDLARAAAAGLPEEQLARVDVAAALKKVPAAPEAPAAPTAPADGTGATGAQDAPAAAATPPAAAESPAAAPQGGAATTAGTAVVPSARTEAPAKAPGGAAAPAAAPTVSPVDALKTQIREALKAGAPEKAKGIAMGVVAARPDDRETRKLLLEAACMSRDWKTVAAQSRLLAPFRDGEEPSMFYGAVGLYETGAVEEARPLMQRARPRVAPTPFVNYYADRLLRDGTPQ